MVVGEAHLLKIIDSNYKDVQYWAHHSHTDSFKRDKIILHYIVSFNKKLFLIFPFSAATVCAFVTNDLIHKQATNNENGFVASVGKSIQGVETYVADTATVCNMVLWQVQKSHHSA
jgi:hypothetical protein